MTPAEQPMPDRLYDTTLDFILKWFTIMALSDGVGLNSEQFTIKMSTWQPAHTTSASSSKTLLTSSAKTTEPGFKHVH